LDLAEKQDYRREELPGNYVAEIVKVESGELHLFFF